MLKWGSCNLQKPLLQASSLLPPRNKALQLVHIIQTTADIIIDEMIFNALRVIVFAAGNKYEFYEKTFSGYNLYLPNVRSTIVIMLK
jgi:hypothetical protein